MDRREVERQVMTFDAPAPRALVGRLAEEGKIIERRVAARGGRGIAGRRRFDLAQHQLDLHDGRRFVITALAERRLEEVVRQSPLAVVEFLERNAAPGARHVEPVEALLVVKLHERFGALLGGQRSEKLLCGFRNGGG